MRAEHVTLSGVTRRLEAPNLKLHARMSRKAIRHEGLDSNGFGRSA
jgi:hypothetical protein